MLSETLANPVDTARILALPDDDIARLVQRGSLAPQASDLGELRYDRQEIKALCGGCSSGAHHHAVQFFDDEEFLADVVGSFLAEGIPYDAPMVVIARPGRRQLFRQRLASIGHRVEALTASGQLTWLDAETTLAAFMDESGPQADRFAAAVRPVIQRARQAFPDAKLRAYGEMVDILWQRGQPSAAVRLEELWNDLAQAEPFSLLCAYAMSNFDSGEHSAHFARVCETHSQVTPCEDSVQDGSLDACRREIAHLQQRVRVLHRRLLRQKELTAKLRTG